MGRGVRVSTWTGPAHHPSPLSCLSRERLETARRQVADLQAAAQEAVEGAKNTERARAS